jgi:hypothetical protein
MRRLGSGAGGEEASAVGGGESEGGESLGRELSSSVTLASSSRSRL